MESSFAEFVSRDENAFLFVDEQPIPFYDILSSVADYIAYPFVMSLFSTFLRIETYRDSETVPRELNRAFEKEFIASQEYHQEPELNYSSLFSDRDSSWNTPLSDQHRAHPAFSSYFRRAFQRLKQSYFDKPRVFFPKYQKNRNVSYDTADQVWTTFDTSLSFPGRSTFDLEVHHKLTGEKVQGGCEMRSAFRYSDLKPRVYYCTGGTGYWASRFLKTFATDMLELLPPCSRKTRYNTDSLNAYIRQHHRVTIYDYSSFTTKLSELRNFLYYLGMSMKGVQVYCVDDTDGLETYDLGDMLLEYNETVNHHAEFTVERLAPGGGSFYQHNSGMLGIQGNIAFSTLLHAINLTAAIDNVDLCKVVGDDAIVVHDDEWRPLDYIIRVVNLLGEVAPEKFCSWSCYEQSQKEFPDTWNYCKRPISVTMDGIQTGILFDIPNPAYAFNLEDKHHRPLGGLQDRIYSFTIQVSSFIRATRLHLDILTDFEWKLIQEVILKCYKKLMLPFDGSLPGFYHAGLEKELKLTIPPTYDEVLYEGWEDSLWKNVGSVGFIAPETSEHALWPDFYRHRQQTFRVTKHRLVTMLEDFGYGESEQVLRYYTTDRIEDKRAWRRLVHGYRQVYEFTFLLDAPDWYNDVLRLLSYEGTFGDFSMTGDDFLQLSASYEHI